MNTSERISEAAKANGWRPTVYPSGSVVYRKPGRGYVSVHCDSAGRLLYMNGARRRDGSDPYPNPASGKAAVVLAILAGSIR